MAVSRFVAAHLPLFQPWWGVVIFVKGANRMLLKRTPNTCTHGHQGFVHFQVTIERNKGTQHTDGTRGC